MSAQEGVEASNGLLRYLVSYAVLLVTNLFKCFEIAVSVENLFVSDNLSVLIGTRMDFSGFYDDIIMMYPV